MAILRLLLRSIHRSKLASLYAAAKALSRRPTRRALLLSILLLSLGSMAFSPPVLTAGERAGIRLFPSQTEAVGKLGDLPSFTARAAVLADARTGAIVVAHNPNEPLAPASTTKIMTALLTLEKGDLDEVLTVTPEALKVGEASMGLALGEQLTIRSLLYGLLIVSGNDAAMMLALHVGGSEQAFVELMNERAQELGMTQTHFVNSHGLDAPGHYASAADLLSLTLEALRQPEFVRIVGTSEATVSGHYLASTNELLFTYRGADGVKTGTTDEAGQCLIVRATRDGGQPLLVLLGSEDRFAEAPRLLDYYFAGYAWAPLQLPEGRLASFTDETGHRWSLHSTEQPTAFLPRWEWPLVQLVRVVDTQAVGGNGSVGYVRYSLGNSLLAQAPLYAVARE